MARRKVRLAFIMREAERKATYKKRKKGLFKKVLELSTLCGVEIAAIIYSAFHRDAEVWPSQEQVLEITERFRALPEIERSKRQVNLEGFTRQRVKKLDDQLRKIRKENRIKEFTNLMYDLLGGQDVPQNMHPYDLNDLTFVLDQNLQKVYDRMTEEARKHGFTFNIPLTRGTNYFPEPRAPPPPPQFVPPVTPIRPMASSMVRPFASSSYAPPPMSLSRDLSSVPPPRMFRPICLSSWPSAPMSPQLFRPMVEQMVTPMPPVVDTRSWATRVASSPMPPVVAPRSWAPRVASPTAATPSWAPSVASPMPPAAAPRSWAPRVAFPMTPAVAPRSWAPSVATSMPQQMAPAMSPRMDFPMIPAMSSTISSTMVPSVTQPMPNSMNSPVDASMPMNDYQNYFYGNPQSPPDWEEDDLMAFVNGTSSSNIFEEPNHHNNSF